MKDPKKPGIDRREFLKKAGLAGLTLAGLELLGCAPAAPAPTPTPTKAPAAAAPTAKAPTPTATPGAAEVQAKLVEEARKEGQVTVYTSLRGPNWDTMRDDFQAKYPFLKAEAFTGGTELIEKAITEAKAGRRAADVIIFSLGYYYGLLKEGLMASYISPEAKTLPQANWDPEGKWSYWSYNVYVTSYNTQKVSPGEAPKSYEDLLDPKWKGKIGLEATDVTWFTTMLIAMGREKGLEFMRRLAQQQPQPRKGHTLTVEMLSAGEFAIAIPTYLHITQRFSNQGSPVKWVAFNPIAAVPQVAGIMKNAPHPNAAKLLIDFILSAEGQESGAKTMQIPARPGVKTQPPGLVEGLQYYVPEPSIVEEVDKNMKLFRDIFQITA